MPGLGVTRNVGKCILHFLLSCKSVMFIFQPWYTFLLSYWDPENMYTQTDRLIAQGHPKKLLPHSSSSALSSDVISLMAANMMPVEDDTILLFFAQSY